MISFGNTKSLSYCLGFLKKGLEQKEFREEIITNRLIVMKENIILDGSIFLYGLLEGIFGTHFDQFLNKLIERTKLQREQFTDPSMTPVHDPGLSTAFRTQKRKHMNKMCIPITKGKIHNSIKNILKTKENSLKVNGRANIEEDLKNYKTVIANDLLDFITLKLTDAPNRIKDILILEKARLKLLGVEPDTRRIVLENIQCHLSTVKKKFNRDLREKVEMLSVPMEEYADWKYNFIHEEAIGNSLIELEKSLIESLVFEKRSYAGREKIFRDTAGSQENYIREFLKELRRILARRGLELQLYGFYDLLKDLYGDQINDLIEKISVEWNLKIQYLKEMEEKHRIEMEEFQLREEDVLSQEEIEKILNEAAEEIREELVRRLNSPDSNSFPVETEGMFSEQSVDDLAKEIMKGISEELDEVFRERNLNLLLNIVMDITFRKLKVKSNQKQHSSAKNTKIFIMRAFAVDDPLELLADT